MSAKEMFEKLGYIENDDRENCLRYTMKGFAGQIIEIRFYLDNDKAFIKQGYDDDIAYLITMPELQAINKQVEELGWLRGEDNE